MPWFSLRPNVNPSVFVSRALPDAILHVCLLFTSCCSLFDVACLFHGALASRDLPIVWVRSSPLPVSPLSSHGFEPFSPDQVRPRHDSLSCPTRFPGGISKLSSRPADDCTQLRSVFFGQDVEETHSAQTQPRNCFENYIQNHF